MLKRNHLLIAGIVVLTLVAFPVMFMILGLDLAWRGSLIAAGLGLAAIGVFKIITIGPAIPRVPQ